MSDRPFDPVNPDPPVPPLKDFCLSCGAGKPPREGEGTCPDCDPQNVRALAKGEAEADDC